MKSRIIPASKNGTGGGNVLKKILSGSGGSNKTRRERRKFIG
jgi:hypothetical protein